MEGKNVGLRILIGTGFHTFGTAWRFVIKKDLKTDNLYCAQCVEGPVIYFFVQQLSLT